MTLQKYIRTIGRCLLSLTFICFSTLLVKSQQQPQDNLGELNQIEPEEKVSEPQKKEKEKNQIPIGLFAYNKWVDLNENGLVESNEFFGLGKDSFAKGEPISASLHDPNLSDGTNLKLRIWDTSGNLIRTIKKNYTSTPMFTYSSFDSFLPVGNYIITINPEETGTTYQIRFSLKEPNGNIYSQIRKKLLPENLYVFKRWIDEDGDMKLDSTEVIALNQKQFVLGDVNFELGLNLPSSSKQVVYQVWDDKHQLMSMKIAKLDSLQHFTMNVDTLRKGNDFLMVLNVAPVGDYLITASVVDEKVMQYKIPIQIIDTTKTPVSEQVVAVEPDLNAELPTEPELVATEDTTPTVPQMSMGTSENVDNLAPEFKKGQEGFFFFTGFIDLNENNVQDRDEFMGADQDYYYSESENIFVQFHLRQFFNTMLKLQILDAEKQLVKEQIGNYGDSPFVFKVSMPDDSLIPGDYQLLIMPLGSEIKYRLELTVK
ncbi:hypothetical protein [Labilibaculum antarcticum]|uniref:Uncharacterized protein n=1 Tax=Labilibaculum antarcticum TaxID=1717717 RepID=A0A1Y1CLL4_9BACT|nr:hypothetical protein [Labilibaculum antarcticum]BAX81309.1 hypothetical protein ALGA_3004 [Labilibaculum antarcticum]